MFLHCVCNPKPGREDVSGRGGQEATALLSQPVLLVATGRTWSHFSSRQAVVGSKLPCPPVFCFQASPALAIDDLTALEKCTTQGVPFLPGNRALPLWPQRSHSPWGDKDGVAPWVSLWPLLHVLQRDLLGGCAVALWGFRGLEETDGKKRFLFLGDVTIWPWEGAERRHGWVPAKRGASMPPSSINNTPSVSSVLRNERLSNSGRSLSGPPQRVNSVSAIL